MRLPLAWLALGGVALAQVSSEAVLGSGTVTQGPAAAILQPAGAQGTSPRLDIPPLPKGNATVIGGAIRKLDRVQDQITLYVFGGRDVKILFDERTQVYRDGQHASLKDLQSGDRVSVETMLDGTKVFARSVRMLTEIPEGEFYGQVVDYNSKTGELTLRDTLSPNPVVLLVAPETRVFGEGHKALSTADLSAGALISARYLPEGATRDVAREITLLALPGSSYMFSGNVTFLDVHAGLLSLVDPRDQKHYEIRFDPALPVVRDLRVGANIMVSAAFDGRTYSASAITINTSSGR